MLYFAEPILAAKEYARSKGWDPLTNYFHAGETDNVTRSQSNLYDAILLGTKRIGHGLGLRDHPVLEEIVKNTGIAIECCPISNQLLRYVSDLRIHPAAEWILNGFPVTLSSDDPQIYGYPSAAPTFDFFIATVLWRLPIQSIHQLALNSILYSSLSEEKKQSYQIEFEQRFENWIDNVYQMTQKKDQK